jgi:hypothetical protein
MYMHTNATRRMDAADESLATVPTTAMTNSPTSMRAAPQMRRGRRPRRSIAQNETGVEATRTMLVMTVIRKGFLMPTC